MRMITLYIKCVVGINRLVSYAMREDEYFHIEQSTGVVTLTQSLDREFQAKFNLTLYAYDQVWNR